MEVEKGEPIMIIERRMSRNPVVASPDMSISEASALMKQEKVHRLPVLDKDKKLVGIITEKDISMQPCHR